MENRTIYVIYKYIIKYIREHNYSPTYDQISFDLGYSKGTVHNAVAYLIEHNYIDRPKWGVLLVTEREYEDD